VACWLLPTPDPQGAGGLAEALGISAAVARVLVRRGLADADEARRFLQPSLDQLHDPLTLRDMPRAVARLVTAIQAHEKILIYGDYDVDGTMSVVLLTTAIRLAGGDVRSHVPHRLNEGYGMRPEVVETAAAQGVTLIVSVDTGIRAAAVVRRAAELSIDVIVTDHHLPDIELPPAYAVVNPNRPGCAYLEKNLCGAAVAFKVAQALLTAVGWPEDRLRKVTDSFLKLVAIATVADVVPLTGENRVMVKHGIDGLRDVRNIGLRALLEVAGFSPNKVPSARQVAFQIAPRINAAGRMDTAQSVIELFLTSDAKRAGELAKQLHEQNAERRQVQAAIVETCGHLPMDQAACALVYYSEDWHRGVIGIVASRMVELFHRPVFVLGRNADDGMAQGSGRSIASFHLLQALESMRDLFVKFGGHEFAAGVTLEAARVEEFRTRFNAYAAERLRPEDFQPTLEIDAVLELSEITDSLTEEFFALAPFGHGNEPPLFAAMDVEVAAPPVVMKEKHLRIAVRRDGRTLKLKAWNSAHRIAEFQLGAQLDIAFVIEEDQYSADRGYAPWSATLKDARPSGV